MKPAKWVMPVDIQEPRNNVWVMITKGRLSDNSTVYSLRVFTEEPHQSVVDYQQSLFSESSQKVMVDVFEVAVDYFDPKELEDFYC